VPKQQSVDYTSLTETGNFLLMGKREEPYPNWVILYPFRDISEDNTIYSAENYNPDTGKAISLPNDIKQVIP